jgi:hypothetical protein
MAGLISAWATVAASRINICRGTRLPHLYTFSTSDTTRTDWIAESGARSGSSAGPRTAARSANGNGADPGMARTNCAPNSKQIKEARAVVAKQKS